MSAKKKEVGSVPTKKVAPSKGIYTKKIPAQHFNGIGVEAKLEIAIEAAKHLMATGQWDVETKTDRGGTVTATVVKIKK
jgi:hypothetical protein